MTPCFVPGEGFIHNDCRMIGEGFCPFESCSGGMVFNEIDSCISTLFYRKAFSGKIGDIGIYRMAISQTEADKFPRERINQCTYQFLLLVFIIVVAIKIIHS